ncbi:MAG: MBL fold metallo-hydrolase [Phycisphaerales bacterium]|nr:MBL fold metallo-hydrolase [Phycisphaerales bacterium]
MKQHGRVNVRSFVEPMFTENGYVVSLSGGDAWIIDPGFAPQPDQIAAYLDSQHLRPLAIVLTHCHVDHIAGVTPLRARYPDVPLWCPRNEQHMLDDPIANLSAAMMMSITAPPAERLIAPGDTLTLGDTSWAVLDVSGHSPGGLAFHCADCSVVFTGDSLFFGSIGRYDFPGSNRDRLLRNIVENLFALPDATAMYSGHGPPSTIGFEKRHNVTLRRELIS